MVSASISFRGEDCPCCCASTLAKACGWEQEKSNYSLWSSGWILSVRSLLCDFFTVLKPPDGRCRTPFWLSPLWWELRILRSQKTASVITLLAVITRLICSEAAQHQHTRVFLLSLVWRLGELILLWDYLLYFLMQTIKNIDKLVRFYQKGVLYRESKYLRDALVFIYQGKRVF